MNPANEWDDEAASATGDGTTGDTPGTSPSITLPDGDHKPLTVIEGTKIFEDSIVISKTRLKKCRRNATGEIIRFKKSVQTMYGDDAEYALALFTAVMREAEIPLDIRMDAAAMVADRILGKPRQEHIVGASTDKVADVLTEQTRDRVAAMGIEADAAS